jgi:peptidoglycan/xylan/chitin deacetylase (PgdA/CDA1 family)
VSHVVIQGLLVAALAVTALPAADAQTKTGPKIDCSRVKCLALTFDDGPSVYTPRLLDTLKREKVKATFFVEGKQVVKHPATVKREAAEGHAVGNHTYSHPWLPGKVDAEITDELRSTSELIKKATGKYPTMFRPPYGETNDQVVYLGLQEHMAQVVWSGTTLDWSLVDSRKIEAAVLRLAKRDGIILMHDVVPETVNVMPKVIKELKQQGYHLVSVPTLIGGKGPQPGETYPKK